ncbi:MAG: UDP-2,3-diacylglucosamine diphosphatase LpxI [Candidatus Aminicenantes bacterium]|nr:UDP-2,3-diacylglucosamine diphosphatase LpxI [Candidatus Aminicenantes bacterium]
MRRRIGLIAGAGDVPRLVLAEVSARGWRAAVAGVRDAADPELAGLADAFAWIAPQDVGGLVEFFRGAGVETVYMAGKVDPRTALETTAAGPETSAVATPPGDRRAGPLLRALINHLAGRGFAVGDPSPFFRRFLCPAGILGRTAPAPGVLTDLAFGWPLARRVADEEIGQTLVVKDGVVVAVEGLEGTDRTILRAGELAGPGTVVLKVGRRRQDPRVDLPAVGLTTVRGLVAVRAAALCIEAGVVPFFQKEEALALSDANGLAVIARPGEDRIP